jgi:hypothetical protein
MSKANFDAVVKLVAVYVGAAKATGLVERRLAEAKLTADQFTFSDLTESVRSRIAGAANLYIAEKTQQDELGKKLAAMSASK